MSAETIRAVAEATKAVAETTGKAIDFADGTATFFSRLIGDALASGGGMITDQVDYWRRMRLLDLEEKFNAACAARGIDPSTMRPLSLGQAVQALQAAAMEESDEVQSLWAELLANAANPLSGVSLKKLHINLLKEVGPVEAALLDLIVQMRNFHGKQFDQQDFKVLETKLSDLAEAKWRKFSAPDRQGALSNLRRLDCVVVQLELPPTDRLLTQSAVRAADRGMSYGRDTNIIGVDPGEFHRFERWIIDAVLSASGATPPKLPTHFPLRNGLGTIVGYLAVPELALALTPLGEELMSACAKPDNAENT